MDPPRVYSRVPAGASTADMFELAFARKDAMSRPHQSSFRVLCLWTFLDAEGALVYASGQNTESCWIHNSYCAERSCLVKLRDDPEGFEHLSRTQAIYIISDSADVCCFMSIWND
jgi:hypothetical protein